MHASHITYLGTVQCRVYFKLFTIFRPNYYPCVFVVSVEIVCDEEPMIKKNQSDISIRARRDVG